MPDRVLIADPHDGMRAKIRSLIEKSGWEVVGEAANGEQCVELARALSPDLVILELNMPKRSLMEIVPEVRQFCPFTKFLVFTIHDADVIRGEVLRAGVHGFAVKSSSPVALLSEARRLLDGNE